MLILSYMISFFLQTFRKFFSNSILLSSEEIPDDWQGAADINCYRSLDRNFVLAGSYLFLLLSLNSYLAFSVMFSLLVLLLNVC